MLNTRKVNNAYKNKSVTTPLLHNFQQEEFHLI